MLVAVRNEHFQLHIWQNLEVHCSLIVTLRFFIN